MFNFWASFIFKQFLFPTDFRTNKAIAEKRQNLILFIFINDIEENSQPFAHHQWNLYILHVDNANSILTNKYGAHIIIFYSVKVVFCSSIEYEEAATKRSITTDIILNVVGAEVLFC